MKLVGSEGARSAAQLVLLALVLVGIDGDASECCMADFRRVSSRNNDMFGFHDALSSFVNFQGHSVKTFPLNQI